MRNSAAATQPSAAPSTRPPELPASDTIIEIEHAGAQRKAFVHVPAGPERAHPVVLNLHGRTPPGYGNAAAIQSGLTRLDRSADRHDFVAVHPQGLLEPDGFATWNAGSCCSSDPNRDDVGFILALLAELARRANVDSSHVFALGISNGGALAQRLACEHPGVVRAVASVAAANAFEPCSPGRPVSVLEIHGTADPLVDVKLAVASNRAWRERNRCGAVREHSPVPGVRCQRARCAAGTHTELCLIEGGGHTWPGGVKLPAYFGPTNSSFDATEYAWRFFKRATR